MKHSAINIKMETFIKEASRNIPVIKEYDVAVLGGGPSGVSAAISAARTGAETALIERYGYPGGQATGGLVILIVGLTDGKNPIIKGLCREFTDDLFRMNAAEKLGNHVLFNPEHMKLLFDAKLAENNVSLYYHRYAAGVITENGEIQAVITEGKSGRQAIKAKIFIDATGDADLAQYCNIPYDIRSKSGLKPVTLGFRAGGINEKTAREFMANNKKFYDELIEQAGITVKTGGWVRTLNPHEAWFNLVHEDNTDCTDCGDLTRAEILTRRKIHKLMELFKKNIPGFENGYIADTAAQIGVRDSRRIRGLYRFEEKDLSACFKDTVCRAPNYRGKGNSSVEIPYRCLLVNEFKNIIFCGRSISVEHEFLDMFREIPCCMATGQAAGVAAGIGITRNCSLHDIDTAVLREKLLSLDVIISEPTSVHPGHELIYNDN